MHKLFPKIPGRDLVRLWVDAVALAMCCLSVIPRSYVVPRERLSPDILRQLAEFLDIAPVIAPGSLFPDRTTSAAELSWLDQDQLDQLRRYVEIYDELLACYSPVALGFHNPRNAYELLWQVVPALRDTVPDHKLLVDRIWETTTAENDNRRSTINVALNKGGISAAESALIKQYALDYPQDGFAHYAMGLALLRQDQDWQAAIREFSMALERGFFEFWTRYNRSYAYEKIEDIEKALADAERAANLDPNHAGARRRVTPTDGLEKEASVSPAACHREQDSRAFRQSPWRSCWARIATRRLPADLRHLSSSPRAEAAIVRRGLITADKSSGDRG